MSGDERRGRTYSGVCHGTLGELFQGPLGGYGTDHIALVSLPIDRYSWVHFTPAVRTGGRVRAASTATHPCGRKSAKAVRLFLHRYGRTLPPGEWTTHTELDTGKGMASSTADVVATLRCLQQLFGIAHDERVVREILSQIERGDSVFLEEYALYFSGRHEVAHRLGRGFGFHLAYIQEPGTVTTESDTVTDSLLRLYRRHSDEYQRCLRQLLKAFDASDAAAVAQAATESALLSQQALPKAHFETLLAHRLDLGAAGIVVAHTGTLLGYLFTHRPSPARRSELAAFFRSFGHQCAFGYGGFR